ncbi:MAG: hypothetical protein JO257_15160 [Deltaproteobacteria bacterium]|nr:hypothetical protein [Deltaproteobacteria bacterium]
MSDLAYNINGESFELPAAASGWRVRRMKQRGAPEVVYGRDGVPLVIPIESDLEELRRSVDAPGRFRLDAVDERGRSIEDVPAAYVQVSSVSEAPVALAAQPQQITSHGTDSVIAEAMRLNTDLARSIIDRFPDMMSAAAELLRAADGAGLPRREPRIVDAEDDDDDEEAAPPSSSPTFELINNLVAQLIPVVMTGFVGKKINIGSALDWRKAAADGQQKREQAPAVDSTSSEDPTPELPPAPALPPLDPKTMAHFIAIQSQLKPDEAALAKQLASELSPVELRAWFDELSKLEVAQAVQKIRTLVAGNSEAVP